MAKLGFRVAFLSLSLATAAFVGACGGTGDGGTSADPTSEPTAEQTVAAPPPQDTVPLEDAKKGDLIVLPAYPLVGMYSGTADVSGLDEFEMTIPLIGNIRTFSPSVLRGSPGQTLEITVLSDEAKAAAGAVEVHDFRVALTPEYSLEHEVVGEQWKADKGTTFTLTFPDEGSVAFFCSYHLRINMAGMLIVE